MTATSDMVDFLHRHEVRAMRALPRLVMVLASWVSGTAAYASGDAAVGKTAFEASCLPRHTTEAGGNGFGPSLTGGFGRGSGSLPSYNFSTALENAGLAWDAPTLDAFLTNTTAKVPGTNMLFAVPDATQRANIIAYLETVGTAPAAAATPSQAAPLITEPTTEELLRAADVQQRPSGMQPVAGHRLDASAIDNPEAAKQEPVVSRSASEAR